MTARVRKRAKRSKRIRSLVGVLAISTKKPGMMLLVTSRHSRSWALAKGNIDHSLGAIESARREAFEEAGVVGRMATAPIGSYIHRKSTGEIFRVKVFKMYVQHEFSSWPEKKERRRRWIRIKSALKKLSSPSLRRVIRTKLRTPA